MGHFDATHTHTHRNLYLIPIVTGRGLLMGFVPMRGGGHVSERS